MIRTEPDRPVPARLAELADDLDELLAEVRPDVVALERVFVRRNLTNAMSVARASGVAMLGAARAGIALHEYTPSEVKATVAGDGTADKGQVARLVASQLGLDEPPRRMECFDISHTQGESTVASCVVFNAAGPMKSDYRRFNLKPDAAGDDYAAMRQALNRRYARLQAGEGLISNNVLHNRTAFSDKPGHNRLLYRARFFDRIETA